MPHTGPFFRANTAVLPANLPLTGNCPRLSPMANSELGQGSKGLALVLTLGQLPGAIAAAALPVGSAEAAVATTSGQQFPSPNPAFLFFYRFIS